MDGYNWLESFKPEPANSILAVNTVLPPVFERYFVVGNAYGIIDNFPFDEYPLDTDSLESLNKRHNIERSFNLFLNYESEELYRQVSIKELAQRFGVEYSMHTLEYISATPGISILYNRSLDVLSRLVSTLVTSPCYLYVEDIDRYGIEPYKGFAFKNDIPNADYYLRFVKEVGTDFCSYLFPRGHNWCLASYEDVDKLILACNFDIEFVVKGIENLEAFEVFPDTVLKSW